MKINLSKTVLFLCMGLSVILSACGGGAPTAAPASAVTDTPIPPTITPTITLTPTSTFTPTATLTPTSTPDVVATQMHASMQTWVEKLASDKIIPSTEGKYYALDDYSDSFAKIRYYTWALYPDLSVSNFIMQAKVKIANQTTENAFKSGCGLVMQNFFDNHAIFLSLDGNANYWSDGVDRGSNYVDLSLYDKNPDGVTLTMVLSNKALHFYVNDQEALKGITIYGEPFEVGTAILSGTSEGFGTRCDFTEVAVWEIK